jgi:hypothetical protein
MVELPYLDCLSLTVTTVAVLLRFCALRCGAQKIEISQPEIQPIDDQRFPGNPHPHTAQRLSLGGTSGGLGLNSGTAHAMKFIPEITHGSGKSLTSALGQILPAPCLIYGGSLSWKTLPWVLEDAHLGLRPCARPYTLILEDVFQPELGSGEAE